MLNEKPADPGGWKDKLDGLDGMAGEPWTGKDAAWDFIGRTVPDALPMGEPMETTKRSILVDLIKFPRVFSVRSH